MGGKKKNQHLLCLLWRQFKAWRAGAGLHCLKRQPLNSLRDRITINTHIILNSHYPDDKGIEKAWSNHFLPIWKWRLSRSTWGPGCMVGRVGYGASLNAASNQRPPHVGRGGLFHRGHGTNTAAHCLPSPNGPSSVWITPKLVHADTDRYSLPPIHPLLSILTVYIQTIFKCLLDIQINTGRGDCSSSNISWLKSISTKYQDS